MLTFIEARTPDRLVLVLDGELTMETEKQFRERVDRLAASGPQPIVMDLHKVRFVDSMGIGALLGLMGEFRKNGRELTVRRVNPVLKLILSNFLKTA